MVGHLATSPEDRVIVRGVIDIAHSLGKVVTAEGVETLNQVNLLHRMTCDLLQGWYFSKACPVADLARVLSTMPTVKGHRGRHPATRRAGGAATTSRALEG